MDRDELMTIAEKMGIEIGNLRRSKKELVAQVKEKINQEINRILSEQKSNQ